MPFEMIDPLPEARRPVRIPIERFAKYEAELGRAMRQAVFRKSMRTAGKYVRIYLEQETIERGIVWRKRFARGWRMRPNNVPSAVTVYNTTPYGIVLEKGRRPNKRPPPVKALVPWVRDKLGLRGKDAVGAAFAISRAIGKRGMPSKATPWRNRRPMLERKTVRDKITDIVARSVTVKLREALARTRP